MRISDWSSDVCSSDLARLTLYPVSETPELAVALRGAGWWVKEKPAGDRHWLDLGDMDHDAWWASRPGALRNTVQRKAKTGIADIQQIGGAPRRERVCKYECKSAGAVAYNKKKADHTH